MTISFAYNNIFKNIDTGSLMMRASKKPIGSTLGGEATANVSKQSMVTGGTYVKLVLDIVQLLIL